MKNDFILIFIAPLAVLGGLELYFFWPNLFYFGISLAVIAILVAVKRITKEKLLSGSLWLSAALPLSFIISISAYSLILANRMAVQLYIFAAAIFLFYYLKNISREGNERFLENISSYGGFLTSFLFFSFLYGIKTFLGVPILELVAASTFLVAALTAQVFWANRIKISSALPHLLIICLIMTQLSWSLYFLSLAHNFLGLILAICYYIAIGIVKPFLRGALSKKTVKLYLICGLSSITLVLLAAKWI
jgi:hypothetical protein